MHTTGSYETLGKVARRKRLRVPSPLRFFYVSHFDGTLDKDRGPSSRVRNVHSYKRRHAPICMSALNAFSPAQLITSRRTYLAPTAFCTYQPLPILLLS